MWTEGDLEEFSIKFDQMKAASGKAEKTFVKPIPLSKQFSSQQINKDGSIEVPKRKFMTDLLEEGSVRSNAGESNRKHKHRHTKSQVVLPDWKIVKKAYTVDVSKVDRMYFENEGEFDWNVLGNDYVIASQNKGIKKFISIVNSAKIETER